MPPGPFWREQPRRRRLAAIRLWLSKPLMPTSTRPLAITLGSGVKNYVGNVTSVDQKHIEEAANLFIASGYQLSRAWEIASKRALLPGSSSLGKVSSFLIELPTERPIIDINKTSSFLDDHRMRVEIVLPEMGYGWKSNEAYVNFANRNLGGGIVSDSLHGFVQEEILMFESNMLPLLWCDKSPSTSVWRVNIVHRNDLNLRPAIFQYEHLFNIKQNFRSDQYYGARGRAFIATEGQRGEASSWLANTNRSQPFIICMAAATGGQVMKNENQNIASMLEVSTKAFAQYLILAQAGHCLPTINTGNWGCGAFGLTVELVYPLQLFAICKAMCYLHIGHKPVTIRYFPYDANTWRLVNAMPSAETLIYDFKKYVNLNWLDSAIALVRVLDQYPSLNLWRTKLKRGPRL